MKSKIALSLAVAFAVSSAVSVQASDNKVTSTVKAVGKGIMWAPKKFFAGMKAVGGGVKKKLTGK